MPKNPELYTKRVAMEEQKISIPLKMAKILVSYFTFTATEQEKDILDEWINESDDNMQVFGDCLEVAEHRPKWINPYSDYYTPPEYWIIADYFTKYTNKTITEFEKNCLAEWRSAQEQNDQFFKDILNVSQPLFGGK